jgi:hypothetical protein
MRIALDGLEADVSTELVKSSKLVDEPLIVELVNGFQAVCNACSEHASCTKFPFCSSIEVKERSVPLYPTGAMIPVVGHDGETKMVPDMRRGDMFAHSAKVKVVGDREVTSVDYSGYEVVADPADPTKIKLEARVKFDEGTKVLEIADTDLYPSGVEKNFLVEKYYEVYPKNDKSQEKADRNKRKLYQIYQKLRAQNKVAIKNGFVWRAGTYQSWAVILEAMTFEDGKWALLMRTTQATWGWLHAQDVPVQEEIQVKPATVNNLQAITSFLSKVKTPPTAVTSAVSNP